MKGLKMFLAILTISVSAIISGCGLQAHTQKVPGTELSDYKTFNWMPSDNEKKNSKHYKNFEESYLKQSIASQLEKKGFREVSGPADVSVDYDVMVENEQKLQSEPVYSDPYIGYRYNRFNGRMTQVYYPSRYIGEDRYTVPYKSGTITVNLVDNKKNEVTWQGWAATEMDRKKLTTDDIDDVVGAIFKKFK